MTAEQRSRALGLRDRPLGPALPEYVTSEEVYRAILEDDPYPVRGLVGFGANLLLAHADTCVAARRCRRSTSTSMPISS